MGVIRNKLKKPYESDEDEINTLKYEEVNHPLHYGGEDNPYEAVKVIEAWRLNFNLGTLLKYIARLGKKPNEDEIITLEKGLWYLQREITIRKQSFR